VNSVSREWRLASSDDPQDEQAGRASTPVPRGQDEFPYRLEIWNRTATLVEQTLAVTISRRVGLATYYAALELYFDKSITLRHKGAIMGLVGDVGAGSRRLVLCCTNGVGHCGAASAKRLRLAGCRIARRLMLHFGVEFRSYQDHNR
jgi:hypothetical protein